MTAKQKVLDLIRRLPDDATFEQINIDLAILESIEESRDKKNRLTTGQVIERTDKAIERGAAE